MRLNIKALALASGILWGVSVFLLTWWLIIRGHGGAEVGNILTKCYIGYTVTALGSLIGLVWGFVEGLICAAIFGWLYNLLVGKFTPTGQ